MAPAVKMPSIPRFSTPDRSQTSAPRTPKRSGVAMRSAAAQKLAETRMSRTPSTSAPPDAVADEEAAHEDREQRDGHDEVGDVVRHAQGAAHGVGAHEDAGDEDRGGEHEERLQTGDHGDHDPGIAEAAGEIG